MRRGVTALVASLLLTVGLPAQSPANGAKALDGRWQITTINGGAAASMAGGEMVLTFKGGTYQQHIGGTLSEEGTVTVDASMSPLRIDLAVGTGPDAGKMQRGLFQVTGDAMSMSLSLPDTDPARTAGLTEGPLVVAAVRVK